MVQVILKKWRWSCWRWGWLFIDRGEWIRGLQRITWDRHRYRSKCEGVREGKTIRADEKQVLFSHWRWLIQDFDTQTTVKWLVGTIGHLTFSSERETQKAARWKILTHDLSHRLPAAHRSSCLSWKVDLTALNSQRCRQIGKMLVYSLWWISARIKRADKWINKIQEINLLSCWLWEALQRGSLL